jgi:hypothetical protein
LPVARAFTAADLAAFAAISRRTLHAFADRHDRPDLAAALRLITLCQGAAHHHAVRTGLMAPLATRPLRVRDIDIWLWLTVPGPGQRPYPWRVRQVVRAGSAPEAAPLLAALARDMPDFIGRIDVLGRSVLPGPVVPGPVVPDLVMAAPGAEAALGAYLAEGRTETARRLAAAPVIGLWPDACRGAALWLPAPAGPTDGAINTAAPPSSS